MEFTVITSDITKFMELAKECAELNFKKKYLNFKGTLDLAVTEEIDKELGKTESQLALITDKFLKAGIKIAMPKENKINEINRQLDNFGDLQIFEALKFKKGEIYGLLYSRGILLKENLDNRANIAKINLLLMKFPVLTRTKLTNLIKDGIIKEDIQLESEESKNIFLYKLLIRLGIKVFLDNDKISLKPPERYNDFYVSEIPLVIGHSCIWVNSKIAEDLTELNKKINFVSGKIQLKNAERQVKKFSDQEEQEFIQFQKNYLDLLKVKDALLEEFYNEDKELIFKFS